MENAYFEGRALKPYGDFVRPAELVVGRVYFKLDFLDQDMALPKLVPWVFIGKNLHPRLLGLYFQDAVSYLVGDRQSADDWVLTFDEQDLGDGFGWGEDIQFEWEKNGDYSSVYEFEGALESLLAC